MSVVTAVENRATQDETKPTRFMFSRWWLIAAIGVPIAAMVYLVVLALNWPFTKQEVINTLQEGSARSVTIDRFYRTYFPPGCAAEGVKFLYREDKNKPPLITIQKLVITGSYSRLLTAQNHLSLVRVFGMHVTVPPKEADGQPNPIMPLNYSKEKSSMKIDKIIADGAVLDFLSNDPAKKPFQLVIDKLALHDVGNNTRIAYKTIISETVPPGKIRSTGSFGPWNPKDPRSTPVSGSYTFQDANLAYFSGISGTLGSSGRFEGELGQIQTEGTAEVPAFKVADTSHERRLATEFRATVDATTGNASLEKVIAHFDRTTAVFQGSVEGEQGEHGKTVSLDLLAANGRIEDLLDLFISAKQSPMTGEVRMRGHIELRPGPQPFVTRLKVSGDFGVDAGKFTNASTQADLTRLSESAEKHRKVQEENPETVLSDLKGHATANNGTATFSNLSFSVPGAKAFLHGTYRLTDYKIDMHGTMVTTGSPSDATTGFKSFLVKAITPLFKKKASQKIVPFKIGGSYGNPIVGLDLGANKK